MFNVFICDKSSLTSNCERSGCVFIAVLLPVSYKSVEQLFVKFFLNSINFLIGSVYLPPLFHINCYKTQLSTVNTFIQQYSSHLIFIWDDCNIPYISKLNNSHGLFYSSSFNYAYLCVPETFFLHKFYQLNNLSNSHGSLIDLVFSNCYYISVTLALGSDILIHFFISQNQIFHVLLTYSIVLKEWTFLSQNFVTWRLIKGDRKLKVNI